MRDDQVSGFGTANGWHRFDIQPEQMDDLDSLRPDVAENQALFAQGIRLHLNPSDVIFFHSGLFHAAGRNNSQAIKESVVFAYHGVSNPPILGIRSASAEDIFLGS